MLAAVVCSVSGADSEGEGEKPAWIDAKVLNVDQQAKIAYGEGDVVMRHRDMTIRADKARYNMTTEEVWLEGNVRVNQKGQEWVTPAALYDLKTHMVKADTAKGMFEAFVIRADNLKPAGTNHYTFAKGTVSTCDYDPPHYRIQATHGEIWPGDRVVLYNVTLRIGNAPVLWFPMFVWSLKDKESPVAVTIGNGSKEGFYVLTRTRFPVNENLTVTLRADERTRRGPGGGFDLDYYYGPARGRASAYYTHDNVPQDEVDVWLKKNLPHNRYRYDWSHKESLTNSDVDVTIRLTKQSDTDFMDDFYRKRFWTEGEPGSIVDVSKRGENFEMSAIVQPQLNPFYAEVERMPEARWSVNRVRVLETPVFYESLTSAGYYHNVAGRTNDAVFAGSSTRANTIQQFVLPQQYFGWLSFVPRAGMIGTYYGSQPYKPGHTNEVHQLMFEAGSELSFKVARTWGDVESKAWDIHGLRHIVEPFINYQWVSSPGQSSTNVFQFDTYRYDYPALGKDRFLTTRYTALDFPANSAIDGLGRQDVARFGLRQKLQTQREGAPWDLVEWDGWTQYNIEQTAMARDFSDFFNALRLAPSRWIAFEADARYALKEKSLKEVNTGASVTRDRWSVTASTRFLQDDSNIFSGTASYRLTRHWTAIMTETYDVQDGTWLYQDYALQQETHDWIFNYGIQFTGQRIGPNENLFYFSISLKAFPGTTMRVNPGTSQ